MFNCNWLVAWLMALCPPSISASDLLAHEQRFYDKISIQEVNQNELEAACGSLAQYYR